MQNPQYPFSGNQSSAGAASQGYSVFQSAADSQLRNPSNFPRSGEVPQPVASPHLRPSARAQAHNLTDQTHHNLTDNSESTWQWRSQAKQLRPTAPIQESPQIQHVPANGHSFAPPANLNQLQRVERPHTYDHQLGGIYKSPIDQAYSGQTKKQSDATDGIREGFQNLKEQSPEQSKQASAIPARDQNTKAKDFVARDMSDFGLFAAPFAESNTSAGGKQLIVLRSQSPKQLAEARAKEAASAEVRVKEPTIELPDAQLLTPNFESYVGSPVLDTTLDAYQDETQWKVYTPAPKVVEAPPAAIFQSLPEPVVEAPPAPAVSNAFQPVVKNAFEPAEAIEEIPLPTPVVETKKDLFVAAPPAPPASDVFGAVSVKSRAASQVFDPMEAKPVETSSFKAKADNHFQVASAAPTKEISTRPSYRFERYETGGDLQAKTIATTVAHSTPVAQPVVPQSGWLSPWWMLICLIPFAMYLMTRRRGEAVEYGYACDEVGERPRLPEEMIERPGYSKSDAIYGESDDFIVNERIQSPPRRASVAEEIPMATHLKTAGQTERDYRPARISDPTRRVSEPVVRFASTNSVQTSTELRSDASPNFRSQELSDTSHSFRSQQLDGTEYEFQGPTPEVASPQKKRRKNRHKRRSQ